MVAAMTSISTLNAPPKSGLNPAPHDGLPILVDIVSSPANRGSDILNPLRPLGKSATIPPMRLQPSTINFLAPLVWREKTKKHALPRSAFENEPTPLAFAPPPLPPAGETRIVSVPFHAKVVIHDLDAAPADAPILLGLFDENPERDQERQINRLAEARAQHRLTTLLRDYPQMLSPNAPEIEVDLLPQQATAPLRSAFTSLPARANPNTPPRLPSRDETRIVDSPIPDTNEDYVVNRILKSHQQNFSLSTKK
jgi:hypothetical protein